MLKFRKEKEFLKEYTFLQRLKKETEQKVKKNRKNLSQKGTGWIRNRKISYKVIT